MGSSSLSSRSNNSPKSTSHEYPPQHFSNIERQFHTPNYTRKSTRQIPQFEPDSTALWGWFLLFTTYFIFVFSMYAIVVSKFVPETGNRVSKSFSI